MPLEINQKIAEKSLERMMVSTLTGRVLVRYPWVTQYVFIKLGDNQNKAGDKKSNTETKENGGSSKDANQPLQMHGKSTKNRNY